MTKDVYIAVYTAHETRVWTLIELGGAACRPLPLNDVIRLARQRWPNREYLPLWDGDTETWESEISLQEAPMTTRAITLPDELDAAIETARGKIPRSSFVAAELAKSRAIKKAAAALGIEIVAKAEDGRGKHWREKRGD